ncbi:MAG: hypothetical protein KDE00_08410 [Rhodobacteraceae bacterium]|nr:hypothetical protein [Paracoccaceae bacterium]
MSNLCLRHLRLAAVIFAPLAGAVAAQDMPSDLVTATLRPGWRTEAGTQMAALELTLAPGWKTYWRAPGEAGIPPEFDWRGSTNVGSVVYHWPKPEVFDLNGMRTLVYHDRLVLPVEITPAAPGQPVSLRAHVALGVCQEVCVPATVDVTGDLPLEGTTDPEIRAALSQMPESGKAAGLRGAHCAAEPIRDGLRLTTRLDLPAIGPDETAVIELSDRAVWVSQADIRREGGTLTAVADLVPPNAKPFALDRSSITITVFGDRGRVVEVQGCTG